MTQKELLYVEDAINHEHSIIGILNNSIDMASDKKIIHFLENELSCHNDLLNTLLKYLEGVSNE